MPADQIVLEPSQRRETVLDCLRLAKRTVALSLFRCDDFAVLDELANARRRGVEVRLLLTERAKGWKTRLRDLAALLPSMGVEIRRYAGAGVKYHAKYLVIDDGPALIASLNFTRKCFDRTCDFLVLTGDPDVVLGLQRLFDRDWGAPESPLPEGLCDRLIVGPEQSRSQLAAMLGRARRSIRIIDHKVKDPAMLGLLETKRAEGVDVRVLGKGNLGSLIPHGKLILVDDAEAVLGSISLATPSLDFRREVAVKVSDPASIRRLSEYFDRLAASR